MPWCPQCRTEYREGFTQCADCGAALVDALPAEDAAGAAVLRQVPADMDPFADGVFTPEEQPVFLVGLEDEEETIRLSELLASCRIPVFSLHRTESEEEGAETPADEETALAEELEVEEWEELDESDDWYDQMMAAPMPTYEIYVPTFLYERALELLEEDEAAHAAGEQADEDPAEDREEE